MKYIIDNRLVKIVNNKKR